MVCAWRYMHRIYMCIGDIAIVAGVPVQASPCTFVPPWRLRVAWQRESMPKRRICPMASPCCLAERQCAFQSDATMSCVSTASPSDGAASGRGAALSHPGMTVQHTLQSDEWCLWLCTSCSPTSCSLESPPGFRATIRLVIRLGLGCCGVSWEVRAAMENTVHATYDKYRVAARRSRRLSYSNSLHHASGPWWVLVLAACVCGC